MSDFYELPSGYWAHNDISMWTITFPEKPPEWMGPILIKLYENAYKAGGDSKARDLREAFSALGFAMTSDLEPSE